ncbi:amino acid ABC transporter permease [Trinickia mobilis]|uniref:amino acid ABC transporter permease n=1 Tax=Trinickia mobilis TaxID=2816356 RepID=UPI001A8C5D75|nr:amino acid ABC transporter permease [Trinickia mobilis]
MSPLELRSLLEAAVVTAWVSITAIAFGIPLGLLLAVIRWQRVPILSSIIAAYVSVIRATPAITLALLVFFALPAIGLNIGTATAAILTLLVNTSAFNCEIWRAALVDFPHDQLLASRAFGMTPQLVFRRIIFPQILRTSLPPLVSEMTLLIKASPAIAVIGIVDLTRAASRIGADTYDPLPPFFVATVLYMLLVLIFIAAQRFAERYAKRKANGK